MSYYADPSVYRGGSAESWSMNITNNSTCTNGSSEHYMSRLGEETTSLHQYGNTWTPQNGYSYTPNPLSNYPAQSDVQVAPSSLAALKSAYSQPMSGTSSQISYPKGLTPQKPPEELVKNGPVEMKHSAITELIQNSDRNASGDYGQFTNLTVPAYPQAYNYPTSAGYPLNYNYPNYSYPTSTERWPQENLAAGRSESWLQPSDPSFYGRTSQLAALAGHSGAHDLNRSEYGARSNGHVDPWRRGVSNDTQPIRISETLSSWTQYPNKTSASSLSKAANSTETKSKAPAASATKFGHFSKNTSNSKGQSGANYGGNRNENGNSSGSKFGNQWRKTQSSNNSSKSSLGSSNSFSLTPPDFDKLELPPAKKDFYSENDHLNDRDSDEIDDYLDDHNISLKGRYQPRPCITFKDLDLPSEISTALRNKNYEKPTPIQAQTWPIALSGDDMVGLAQTGSGKTCAFVIPGLVHILNNKEMPKEPNNPLMLVLCPTRELSQQVAQVTEEFASSMGINVVCVYGGTPRSEQSALLKNKRPEILVATPGRLLDFMESKEVDIKLVSYLVLDEADRMLDMGFEPQIRSIIDNIRPDRQTLMFSATWPDEVWQLAEDFLDSYTKVNVGSQKLSANHQITQVVECCEEEEKPGKILELLKDLVEKDKTLRTLIFCDTKRAVNDLHKNLNENHFKAEAIHGNKKQYEREFVLKQFSDNKIPILIATDVAARGLDISGIKHVINYDYPASSEDYVHRIGRTARGSTTGMAYSFFTQANMGQSGKLISILEEANQEVPTMLKFYASFVKQR